MSGGLTLRVVCRTWRHMANAVRAGLTFARRAIRRRWPMALMMLLALPAWADFTPTADFIDHGDGTVTHKLTGLTWMRCSLGQTWTGSTCAGSAITYTWADARDEARGLSNSFAGKSGWRLPTPWELVSIVDYDIANNYPDRPVINLLVFPNTPKSPFWSASARAGSSKEGWFVDFSSGSGHLGIAHHSYSNGLVRLVRGGQSSALLTTPSSDFIDRGDGTVTHKRTNLIWKRCAEGQSWTGSTCSGTAHQYSYDRAAALRSNFAGQNDWRLPNIQELLSIVEYGASHPAINAAVFPTTPSFVFWSASDRAGSSYYALFVNFYDGSASIADRSTNGHVRLVRGGQTFASFDSAGARRRTTPPPPTPLPAAR